jgi:hypothetical protein
MIYIYGLKNEGYESRGQIYDVHHDFSTDNIRNYVTEKEWPSQLCEETGVILLHS